jgi:hypothetical protein
MYKERKTKYAKGVQRPCTILQTNKFKLKSQEKLQVPKSKRGLARIPREFGSVVAHENVGMQNN